MNKETLVWLALLFTALGSLAVVFGIGTEALSESLATLGYATFLASVAAMLAAFYMSE